MQKHTRAVSPFDVRRSTFITGAAALGASLMTSTSTGAQGTSAGAAPPSTLMSYTFTSSRHTTHYWEAGPANGPLMIFLHGWPEIGLMWRAHVDAFAAEGWRCVAPDMRGYGASAMPASTDAYTQTEIVQDMAELHDHLGGHPAIWIGHDWGSPVAGEITAHYPSRSRGTVLMSVAYYPEGFALPTLVPLIDRQLYPAEKYPYGQWDYFRFYQTNFESTVTDFNADIAATLASIYRLGNPAAAGKLSPSALVTANGGRYGAAHRAPPTAPEAALWPADDFDALVDAFKTTGFRAANAWYLHDAENIAFARTAPGEGRLSQPVLFINSAYDPICDITGNRLGVPMNAACKNLSLVNSATGHWGPLEHKAETIEAIKSWLKTQRL
jgi:pimeloyl-ACP methyl ester carboxylesterase